MTAAPTYDFAVLLSQTAMNSIAQQVYTTKPGIFKGQTSGSAQGQAYTVAYQVNQPPTFDLSPNNPALKALHASSLRAASLLMHRGDLRPGLSEAASAIAASLSAGDPAGGNAFTLINSVLITTTIGQNPPGAPLQFTATITASVTVSGSGALTLTASNLTLQPNQPPNSPPIDPFTLWIINTYGGPSLLGMVNGLLNGVSLPPLSVAGLSLSPPTFTVTGGALVIACMLTTGGGSPSTLSSLPSFGEIGVAISQRGLQTAVQMGVGKIASSSPVNGSGKSGGSGFNAHYDYGLSFGTPSVSVSGTDLNLTMGLAGGAHAGITFLFMDFDVGYSAYASPTPTAHLQPSVVGGELWINIASFNTFSAVLVPSGSVSSVIAGALAWLVVEPVVAAVVAAASGIIKNIAFKVTDLPAITFGAAGITISAQPNNVQFTAMGADALLFGAFNISVSGAPHLTETDSLAAGGAQTMTVPMLLWAGAAAGQTAQGGLYFAGSYVVCGTATINTLSSTALTVSGKFAIDAEIEGHYINAAGSFSAGVTVNADGSWTGTLTALTTQGQHVDWSTTFQSSVVNGVPTLTGVISAGGSPVPVQITFQVQNQTAPNPSFVYAFPQTTGPGGQPLPSGYLRYPPET